jgi:DNA repair protein RecO (recombination protein O)
MLHKTRAIVIKTYKYSETSLIVKAYTELFGLQSYLINGVRSEKAKMKVALFQPLVPLAMVVYHKLNTEAINRVSEVKCAYPFQSIPYDMKKTSLAFFMSELLSKTVHEEPNEDFFEFLYNAILFLDQKEEDYDNFALQFLLGLLKFSGFLPENSEIIFLELYQAKMIKSPPTDFQNEQIIFSKLQKTLFNENIKISGTLRTQLVHYLLDFCKLHWEFFGELKSLHILRDILRNE